MIVNSRLYICEFWAAEPLSRWATLPLSYWPADPLSRWSAEPLHHWPGAVGSPSPASLPRACRRTPSQDGRRTGGPRCASARSRSSSSCVDPASWNAAHTLTAELLEAGSIPSFLWYITIPELCLILDTRYLRCKSSLLKLLIIFWKKLRRWKKIQRKN